MQFKGNSPSLQKLIERIQGSKSKKNKPQPIEALGTDQGSSFRSETPDTQTSPTASSCPTPNSSSDLPDSELTFTIGATVSTPYLCQFCEKAFARLSFLKTHEQVHSDQLPYRCNYCSRLFKHKRSRDRHIKLHTGDKKYKCTLCDAAFSRSDHLKIHKRTHDSQKPYQCSYCNRGYSSTAALTSHLQHHKKQDSSMSAADVGVEGASTSSKIMETNDGAGGSIPQQFVCDQCRATFEYQEQLLHHVLVTHSGQAYGSDPCSSSSIPGQCIMPLPLMPQISPKLACIYCTQDTFTTMEELQNHVQAMHSEITSGAYCGYPQNEDNKADLPLKSLCLMNSSPGSTKRLMIPCDLCMMQFPDLETLRRHSIDIHKIWDTNKHKDDVIYDHQGTSTCNQCNMVFQSPVFLNQHMLAVHNLNPPPQLPGPPEQLVPTDLSRKIPRTNLEEDRSFIGEPGPSHQEAIDVNIAAGFDYTKLFMCGQCNATFPSFEAFRMHVGSHLEQSTSGHSFLPQNVPVSMDNTNRDNTNTCIVCQECGTSFGDMTLYEQHAYSHFLNTDIEHSCMKCLCSFPTDEILNEHFFEAHTQYRYKCEICDEKFIIKSAIESHYTEKHKNYKKVYKCTACPRGLRSFKSKLEFTLHVREAHISRIRSSFVLKKKKIKCLYCLQIFSNDFDLQLHMPNHFKQFKCQICNQSFNIEFLLDRHIAMFHSNIQNINGDPVENRDVERSPKKSLPNSPQMIPRLHPSPGRLSQKSTTSENNNIRKQHEVSQTTNCDICDRNDFSNESELLAHRKLAHHTRSNAKNGAVSLSCAYCNEICKTRSELENHMKNHSNSSSLSGKHKCNICDEICSSAIYLAEHKLTHCKVTSSNCCTHCRLPLTSEEQFYSHLLQHANNNNGNNGANQKNKIQITLPSPCVICRQTLISEVEVRIHSHFHMRQSNASKEDVKFPCFQCFKLMQSQNLIFTNNKYVCSDCYALNKDNISQQQCCQCPECHFLFESVPVLEQHLKTVHPKQVICHKCNVVLDTDSEAQLHAAAHMMIEDDSIECHLCRRMFDSPAELQTHLIEHTFAGCSAFTCYLCSAVFTGSQGLQSHIVEHGLAARPYDCHQCNRKFFFRAELDNHIYSHLKEQSRPTDSGRYVVDPTAYYFAVQECRRKLNSFTQVSDKHSRKLVSKGKRGRKRKSTVIEPPSSKSGSSNSVPDGFIKNIALIEPLWTDDAPQMEIRDSKDESPVSVDPSTTVSATAVISATPAPNPAQKDDMEETTASTDEVVSVITDN